jgi:dTDP-4-amino-4,6-dideoxygalactose transaminase
METTQTMHRIGFLDLKGQHDQIKAEVFARFEEVYEKTAFSGGPFVETFENEFAAFCDTKYAVACNNGTSALHLAMLALGIGPGDEVIIPANTFIATAWGVSYSGATPVFADCDPNTWEIDVETIASKITRRTKAIVGVHLYGQPFDVDAVATIAASHGLFLLEDAAQAHGARYKGKKVGSLGEMGCFSFYPGKNLGACGEGGGITTNNEAYLEHLHSLRNHGSKVRYYHDELGFNMRMGGLEAASLSVKLRYLNEWNIRRKSIAQRYFNEMINADIRLQAQPDFSESVFHLMVATVKDRSDFTKYLNEKNIYPGLHYPVPCHLQNAYSHLGYREGDFPNAEYLSSHCVSLPMYAELSDEEVSYVIDALNNY